MGTTSRGLTCQASSAASYAFMFPPPPLMHSIATSTFSVAILRRCSSYSVSPVCQRRTLSMVKRKPIASGHVWRANVAVSSQPALLVDSPPASERSLDDGQPKSDARDVQEGGAMRVVRPLDA